MDNDQNNPEFEPFGVRIRHCPACRSKITSFAFTGLFAPLESHADALYQAFEETDLAPLLPILSTIECESFAIGLAGLCPCTYVSLWNAGNDEVRTILNNSDASEIYRIEWIYSPERLRDATEKLKSKNVNEHLIKRLEWAIDFYGPKNQE